MVFASGCGQSGSIVVSLFASHVWMTLSSIDVGAASVSWTGAATVIAPTPYSLTCGPHTVDVGSLFKNVVTWAVVPEVVVVEVDGNDLRIHERRTAAGR